MDNLTHYVLTTSDGWMILGIFSVIWIFLGWYWGRKNKTLEDYMLAGRNVGLALGVATAMATWVTTSTTMAAPQFALQLGIWGMLGYSLGSVGLILFAPLAKRIKHLMPSGFTSGDFIRLRFGNTTWRVFLVVSLIYAVGWLVTLGMAGGLLVEALTGIPYLYGMTVILVICVTYTLLGGLRAVIGTDFIQTILIIVGITTLAILAITEVGFEKMHSSVLEQNPELLNLLMPASIMFLFNNLLFGVGEIFHSNVWWSRAYAFRKNVGARAYLLSGLFWMPIPVVAGFIALAAPALGVNIPSADKVGPIVAANLLGYTGAVLVFIVVFSALASSLDSLLAATSDLVLQDIYRGHINPDASKQLLHKKARWIILLLGALTWFISALQVDTLGSVLQFLGAFVASTIWPIIAGLYWRRLDGAMATTAMLLGIAAGLTGFFVIGFYVAALVSAAVSMLVTIIGVYLAREQFDWTQFSQQEGVSR